MATWSSLKVVATAQDSAASRSQYCSIASVRVWHKHTYFGCRSGLHEKTPPSFINLHVDINRGAIHLHLHLRRHTYRTLLPHILSSPPHLPTPSPSLVATGSFCCESRGKLHFLMHFLAWLLKEILTTLIRGTKFRLDTRALWGECEWIQSTLFPTGQHIRPSESKPLDATEPVSILTSHYKCGASTQSSHHITWKSLVSYQVLINPTPWSLIVSGTRSQMKGSGYDEIMYQEASIKLTITPTPPKTNEHTLLSSLQSWEPPVFQTWRGKGSTSRIHRFASPQLCRWLPSDRQHWHRSTDLCRRRRVVRPHDPLYPSSSSYYTARQLTNRYGV